MAWCFLEFYNMGGIHGLALSINHIFRKFVCLPNNFLFRNLAFGVTFLTVSYAWVFFRASNIDVALNMTKVCFGISGIDLPRFFSFFLGSDPGLDFIHVNGAFSSPFLNYHSVAYLFGLFLIIKFFPTTSQWMKWSNNSFSKDTTLRKIGITWAYCMGLIFFISIKPLFDSTALANFCILISRVYSIKLSLSFLLGLSSAFGLWYGNLQFASHKSDINTISHYNLWEYRTKLLESKVSPKMVLCGGSNVTFSTRAYMIEKAFGLQ